MSTKIREKAETKKLIYKSMLSFKDFVNEKLDFKFEHDVEKEFDYLNKLLFNSELILPPYSFDVNKNRSAWVYSEYWNIPNMYKEITLHFSKNCILTPEQFRNTLAHEMIHLWLYHKNILKDYGGPHGVFFTREMDRINNMNVGIKISPKNDEITPFQQRKELKSTKDFYVILFTYRDELLLCPFSVQDECEKFWNIGIESLSKSAKITNKPITIWMCKNQMYEINHFTIARTAKNVKQFAIKKDLFDKIIEESEILKKETLNP